MFADAGIKDIRLPYPVNPINAPRLLALMDRATISIIVDHLAVARGWSEAMQRAGRTLDVLIKVDVGFHRCGIDPGGQCARLHPGGRGAAGSEAARAAQPRRPRLSRAVGSRAAGDRAAGSRDARRAYAPAPPPRASRSTRSRSARRRRCASAPASPASPSCGPATTSTSIAPRSRSAPPRSTTAR